MENLITIVRDLIAHVKQIAFLCQEGQDFAHLEQTCQAHIQQFVAICKPLLEEADRRVNDAWSSYKTAALTVQSDKLNGYLTTSYNPNVSANSHLVYPSLQNLDAALNRFASELKTCILIVREREAEKARQQASPSQSPVHQRAATFSSSEPSPFYTSNIDKSKNNSNAAPVKTAVRPQSSVSQPLQPLYSNPVQRPNHTTQQQNSQVVQQPTQTQKSSPPTTPRQNDASPVTTPLRKLSSNESRPSPAVNLSPKDNSKKPTNPLIGNRGFNTITVSERNQYENQKQGTTAPKRSSPPISSVFSSSQDNNTTSSSSNQATPARANNLHRSISHQVMLETSPAKPENHRVRDSGRGTPLKVNNNEPPAPSKYDNIREAHAHTRTTTMRDLSILMLVRPTKEELIRRHILPQDESNFSDAQSAQAQSPRGNNHDSDSSVDTGFLTRESIDEDISDIAEINTNNGVIVTGSIVFQLLNGENVILQLPGVQYVTEIARTGILYVSNYRFIFVDGEMNEVLVNLPIRSISSSEKMGGSKEDELCKIEIETKDFRKLYFLFDGRTSRKQAFEILKLLMLQPITKAFAFSYKEPFDNNGWDVFVGEREYERMIGQHGNAWRLSGANKSYKLCPSYPTVFGVPARVSDNDLHQVASYRSKGRVQALSWVHPNSASISRCSQPRVGVTRRRSTEDEKMMTEILATNKNGNLLQIFDARPVVNARANQVKGAGFEQMNHYPNCKLTFHDIENIHVMRESLIKVMDAASSTDDEFKWLTVLDSSQWLHHLSRILTSVVKLVECVDKKGTSVVVHCSDGWDRTPQLTGLSCLLLDPYYRTIVGFEVLVEKEFCAFGHQFALRTGHDNAKPTERAPIFLQFIDCVYQLTLQFPREFEFNEKFLLTLVESLYSCRFGTFLYDCERERNEAKLRETTISLWTYINAYTHDFYNHLYQPSLTVVYPNASLKKMKLWETFYFKHYVELKPQNLQDMYNNTIEDYKQRILQLEHMLANSSTS